MDKLPVLGTPSPDVDLGMTPDELEAEIKRLKRERNAVILAHYYQESEIQDLADFVGDSLQLSQAAAKTSADVIVFCGVHFMAETAKILNPDKVVVIPDLAAGCSLADGCPAPVFKKWLEQYPGHTVVSYINCSAEVKALSDVICTSSNAVKIVKALGDRKIVFAPDRYLGAFVAKQANRPDLITWQGTCIVHETFSEKRLLALMVKHPDAEVIAHPECHEGILRHAAHVASTSGLIEYARTSPTQTFIVATEAGILHKMQQAAPTKTLIPAPPEDETCSCNVCPFMRLNTLEKLYLCMRDLSPQIEVPEATRVKALKPIQRMLEMSV
ncbi:MAG: quinolinate synthetase complex, subunit [Deltaproteobacteria bacterium]|nr:quinolinate synthetase complex, subunit [Deltaproteobacteria bacterium]